MKSPFGFLGTQNAILTNSETLKFDYYEFLHFLKAAVFANLNSPKLISRKISMIQKS